MTMKHRAERERSGYDPAMAKPYPTPLPATKALAVAEAAPAAWRGTEALTSDPLQRHRAIVQGVPARALLALVKEYGEKVVDVSEATLKRYRKKPDAPLSRPIAERTVEVQHVIALATRVLGGETEAQTWLGEAQRALDFQRPMELIQTEPGRLAVTQLLGRIEYGVYT